MEKFTVRAEGKDRLDILNRISTLYLQKRIQVESFEFTRTAPEQGEYKITCFSDCREELLENRGSSSSYQQQFFFSYSIFFSS